MNYFGTDGIRGQYGSAISDGTAFLLGKSLATLGKSIVVGRDSRVSGEKLLRALTCGIEENGAKVIYVGILPTNAVSFFVINQCADFGVMISASHNPPKDNGLKVFDRFGCKANATLQEKLSHLMSQNVCNKTEFENMPNVLPYAEKLYADHLFCSFPVDLDGLKIGLDCCFGATTTVAKRLFALTNADVNCYCAYPNGHLINVGCGATNVNYLASKTKDFDVGFAFDGDGDRIAVCQKDGAVDNTTVFFAIAKYLAEWNMLSQNAVCGTVLTNGGLQSALKKINLGLLRSKVGDANLFELMQKENVNLGAEESGHVIFSDYAKGSDALLSALVVAKIFKEKGDLRRYAEDYVPLPSFAGSVKAENVDLAEAEKLAEGLDCRVVVRLSGTESNTVRVYTEGNDGKTAFNLICSALKSE